MKRVRILTILFLAAALLGTGTPASAQCPQRSIQWIVPYPAGGGSDAIARVVTQAMQASLGQPLVIDNRPGASTNIGVAALLQARPDGCTVMQAQEAALALNAHLFSKLPYDPRRDFTFIGAMARLPVALVVDAASPIRSVKDLIDHVKADPQRSSYASPGIGTPHHLAMELFKRAAGLQLPAVPYKGGAAALGDLLGGHVTTMMLDLGTGLASIRSGKLRVLAVASRERARALPDVPTLDELGYKGASVDALQALIGPSGMPKATVKVLNAALNDALRDPKVLAFFAEIGAEALPGSPGDLERLAREADARWGPIIKALEMRID